MEDWRLEGQTNYFKGLSLLRIEFPDFWEKSFVHKNDFYNLIKNDGETFVKKYKRGEEYLVGDKVQDFWHTHCIFCTEKITTRDNRICYCIPDYSTWICQKCFDDFKVEFNWKIINNL